MSEMSTMMQVAVIVLHVLPLALLVAINSHFN